MDSLYLSPDPSMISPFFTIILPTLSQTQNLSGSIRTLSIQYMDSLLAKASSKTHSKGSVVVSTQAFVECLLPTSMAQTNLLLNLHLLVLWTEPIQN